MCLLFLITFAGMKKIYLDNAATTPVLPEVIDLMTVSFRENFGNPSSSHSFGRLAKTSVEKARKRIAALFNASANEIVFTSGGSEADNFVLKNAVRQLGVKRIISSKLEHHAVLHSLEDLRSNDNIHVDFVDS